MNAYISEERLNFIMRKCFEAIYSFVIVDKKYKIIYINQNYSDLLGINKEDAIGRDVRDVIPGTNLHTVVETGKSEIGEIMKFFNHKTKKEIILIANRIPIFDKGKIIGAIGQTAIEDINVVNKLKQEIDLLKNENAYFKNQLLDLRSSKFSIQAIYGNTPQIKKLKSMITQIADSNVSVLITGETGTGKEVVANAIHQASKRRNHNFVKINCAAIPKDLLESELFGYEEGAFTGANKKGKKGKFEMAHNGTILLDEIGEMPLPLQSKLLRVLQEKEFEKVGGVRTIPFTARLLSSTNRNLEEMVKEGLFREDLYYRINVIELNVPPLRERLESIPTFCTHFIEEINQENGLHITGIDSEVYPLLQSYSWPGNIRELRHSLERACVLLGTGQLKKEHFDFLEERIVREKQEKSPERKVSGSLRSKRNQSEREEIIKALQITKGNKTETAKLLGICRSSLYSKLKEYQI